MNNSIKLNIKKAFVLFGFLICFTNGFGHKYYVSIANLEYNEKTKEIEVSLKMSAHDFEHVLEKKFNKKIDIEMVFDTSKVGLFVQKYLKSNFLITSAGSIAKLNYMGKEISMRDELVFYFTFKPILNPSHITIQNSILFGLFSKQQNIVHYKYNGVTKSGTLINNKPTIALTFK